MNWPTVPFGELTSSMVNGMSPSSSGKFEAEVLTLTSITRGVFDDSYSKRALLDREPASEQLVDDSTFLVCRGNGNRQLVGVGVFARRNKSQLVFPDTIIGCKIDQNRVHASFLESVWRSPLVRSQLEAAARTTNGTYKINQTSLASVTLPLPPLPEQKRIAAILDKADAIRRKRQEAIRLTEELLRAAFLEMFGDPVTNPKEWEVKALGELIAPGDRLNYGVVQPGQEVPDGIPLIRVGDFDSMAIERSSLKCISSEVESQYSRSRLIGDEILLACVGSIGKVAIASPDLRGCNIARAITRIRLRQEYSRHYFAQALASPSVQAHFLAETRTVSQPTLNVKQIGETKLPVPPIQVQARFEIFASKLLKLAKRNSAAVNHWGALQSTLSSDAFSGRL